MANNKIFYAITTREYSEHHIAAITDDKKRAEELNRVIPASNIEEFPDAPVVQSSYWIWNVYRDANTHSITVKSADSSFEIDDLNKVGGSGSYTWTTVLAMNEPHALKIAYDLFAQFDAAKAGIT